MKKNLLRILVALLITGLNWTGIAAVGYTVSFYNDTEGTTGNGLTANTLDFVLNASAWVSAEEVANLEPGESVERDVHIQNNGGLDFKYMVRANMLSGNQAFCDALELKAELESNLEYSGPLLDFVSGIKTFSTSTDEWSFEVSLPGPDEFDDKTCEFEFRFSGWQYNFSVFPEGFHDEEIVANELISAKSATSTPEEPGPQPGACPANAPTIVVSVPTFGHFFDYGDANVVIASGGALISDGEPLLDVNTNCDLTVEDGGEISSFHTTNAPDIRITVGGNLAVAGESIKAESGNSSQINNGGDITIVVNNDFVLSGLLSSYGQENSGNMDIDVDGNFHITREGELKTRSGASSHINTGGNVLLNVGKEFLLDGLLDTHGQENSGSLTAEITKDMNISLTGRLLTMSGDSSHINTGGDVDLDIGGTFTVDGELNTYGQERAGNVVVSAEGNVSISGNSVEATSGVSSHGNNGGIVRIVTPQNIEVSGLIDVFGQEQGGIIELFADKTFSLTSTGLIQANSGASSHGNGGGNISIISRDGTSILDGEITSNGQERGGNIAITSYGDLTLGDNLTVNATGNTSHANIGGTIVITTPMHLTISSNVEAIGPDASGAIQTNYCTKNFAGSSFTPAPLEITNCQPIVINEFLPNPVGADDALLPNGELVELYNYGPSDVDIAGWFLYDDNDNNELEITGSNTGSGNTIVPTGSFLVVYRNGDSDFALNNSGGDQVRLFSDRISNGGTLKDFHSYSASAPNGKSFARVPDGGVWYDPEPTPGKSNARNFDYYKYFFEYSPDKEIEPEELEEQQEEQKEEATQASLGGSSSPQPQEQAENKTLPLDEEIMEEYTTSSEETLPGESEESKQSQEETEEKNEEPLEEEIKEEDNLNPSQDEEEEESGDDDNEEETVENQITDQEENEQAEQVPSEENKEKFQENLNDPSEPDDEEQNKEELMEEETSEQETQERNEEESKEAKQETPAQEEDNTESASN